MGMREEKIFVGSQQFPALGLFLWLLGGGFQTPEISQPLHPVYSLYCVLTDSTAPILGPPFSYSVLTVDLSLQKDFWYAVSCHLEHDLSLSIIPTWAQVISILS